MYTGTFGPSCSPDMSEFVRGQFADSAKVLNAVLLVN